MDRSIRGAIAGALGGIIMNLWSFFMYNFLNIKIVRFLDWAGYILYGDFPQTNFEIVYAMLIQIVFVSFLGVIFAFMIAKTTSQAYILKGIFFSLGAAFIIYAVPVFFEIDALAHLSLVNVMSNHFGGILWGVTMAYVLEKLDHKKDLLVK